MMLIPPAPGTCPICAVNHKPELPHDWQSIYYHYRFYAVRGRWPTWADAVAHCAPNVRAHWERELRKIGKWREPADGDRIADPPAESIHQPIGDIGSRSFGREEATS